MKIVKSEENKNLDGYYLADIATTVTILLFVLFITGKTGESWFAFGIALISAALIYAMFSSSQLQDETEAEVCVKDENTEETVNVLKGETVKGIDGAKVAGTVYKIPDGVHAVVMNDNTIKIRSLWGRLIYKVRGGELSAASDEAWKPLFEA